MKRVQTPSKGPARRPDDAVAIAAMRNFAIDVERLLVRIYVTDRSKYEKLVHVMRTMLHEIYQAGTDPKLRAAAAEARGADRKRLSEENCPPGWELCSDGLCAEVCYIADVES
jgi:hypothetical protein